MTYTLPPKVIGEIEGRLDILVLRPVLIPSLQSSQSLDFFISWWGDDKHSVVRLLPNIDEVKYVFNICCDINRFQKYLDDAEEVVLEVFVSDRGKSVQPTRHLHKNKKEWKNGEYIGRFQIKGIKLNSRGEFVYEGNICNKYGDICGSLVVFMLYTAKYNLGLDTECYFSSPEKENKELTTPHTSPKQSLELPYNAQSAVDNAPVENGHTTSVGHTNNLSSPSDEMAEHEKHCEDEFEQSYISEADLLEYLPDKSLLITRLFSFVDSGAIQLSDVPTLLQICQERSSPQLDHSVIHPGIKLPPDFIVSSNVSLNTNTHVGGKDNKLITADSRVIPMPYRPFRSSSEKSHSDKKINEDNSNISLSPKLLNTSLPMLKAKCDSNEKDVKLTSEKNSDASLVIISVSTINLKPYDKRDISMETKPKSSRQLNFQKKNAVRQRSKVCYFLQISVFDHKNSEDAKTILFVSRQIENGVIFYHKNEILPLPNKSLAEEIQGCMKVRVIRRKLGERLGTEIGIGLVSLKNLYVIRDKKVQLKLWLPNKENESQQTVGKLEFSVAFALLSDVYPSLNLNDTVERGVSYHSPADINDNVNLRTSPKTNDFVAENQERLSSCEADISYPLQQFNIFKGSSEHEGCEDSKIFPLKENEEKGLEISYTHLCNPHMGDAYSENYKNSRRKLFDPESLNLSVATHSFYKVTKKHDTSSDEGYIGAMQQKEQLNKDISNQEINNIHSILYAEASSSLEHSYRDDTNCEVLLEIREGRNFPMLLSSRSDCSFAPNIYVRFSLQSVECETCVMKNSVSPKWNFRTSMKINREDFNQTNDHFMLLVFHSRNGVSPGTYDPILGFVALDIQLLWTSVISLSGWVPVLNKNQSICGEINITLTSLKSMVADSREVIKGDKRYNNNSISKSAGDGRESSTQTSQIWCNPLYCNHLRGNDDFPKDIMYCNVNSIKGDANENIRPSFCSPMLSKEICGTNLTSSKSVLQAEVNEPICPVGNETFIISRAKMWSDSDKLKELEKIIPNSQTKIVKSCGTSEKKHSLEGLPKLPTSNVDAFTWNNQLESLDTPCASYIDFKPYNYSFHDTSLTNKENEILPAVTKAMPTKLKRIKCRIAANINMPKFM